MKTDSGVTFRYENGIFNVAKKDGTAVYGEPTNDGKLLGRLKLNDEVTYDYKYVNDGYIWISYEKIINDIMVKLDIVIITFLLNLKHNHLVILIRLISGI